METENVENLNLAKTFSPEDDKLITKSDYVKSWWIMTTFENLNENVDNKMNSATLNV